MAKVKSENQITQSLLSRLVDDDVVDGKEWPKTRKTGMEFYRDGVKRDIEWLLNSRRPPIPQLQDYPQAYASVINFGLPDVNMFTGSTERDHNALLLAIVQTLRDFEPRVQSPRAILLRTDSANRSLRFHIEGRSPLRYVR